MPSTCCNLGRLPALPPPTHTHLHPHPCHAAACRVGARVMAGPSGRPLARDPLFLLEAKLASAATAARMEAAQAAAGTCHAVACGFSSAHQTACAPGQDGAITIYSEAAAAGCYGATVYVRAARSAQLWMCGSCSSRARQSMPPGGNGRAASH
jgi:hypothetical protein